jgi:glycerate kinase
MAMLKPSSLFRRHNMSPCFVLAPDSFKESLSALEACQAMQRGIVVFLRQWQMGAKVQSMPY